MVREEIGGTDEQVADPHMKPCGQMDHNTYDFLAELGHALTEHRLNLYEVIRKGAVAVHDNVLYVHEDILRMADRENLVNLEEEKG